MENVSVNLRVNVNANSDVNVGHFSAERNGRSAGSFYGVVNVYVNVNANFT